MKLSVSRSSLTDAPKFAMTLLNCTPTLGSVSERRWRSVPGRQDVCRRGRPAARNGNYERGIDGQAHTRIRLAIRLSSRATTGIVLA